MTAVSVVIPAYNAARTIGAALESIHSQTMQDFEVIVVDDGSRDATVDLARGFAGVMRIEVIVQANWGPAAARNNGIRAAAGRYCAFLDSDDLMFPERLALQAGMLDAQPQLGLVHTDLMTFDDSGIIHRSRRAFSNPCGGEVLDRLLLDNFITTSTVMAPRAKLLEVGLFGEARRISEDFELWLKIAERWPIGYLEQPLVKYRRSPDSASGNKLATALAALDVIDTFWREHPDYGRAHRAVRRRSFAHHLATAGSAAFDQGQRSSAIGYLGRALANDPLDVGSWKSLAKTLISTPHRPARAGRQAPGSGN